MKLILTARVSKLGQIGEVVEVKNGYAKNFLIPSKKAICFTVNNQKIFEAKRAEFEKANEDNQVLAKKLKEKLVGKDIIVIESASDDGRLYGSVSSSVIASKINDVLGAKSVSRSNVFLKKPIKEIGVYQVSLELHSDVELECRVIVTRSESEIDALLKADLKAKKKAEQGEEKEEKSAADEAAKASESEVVDGEKKEKKSPRKSKKKEE